MCTNCSLLNPLFEKECLLLAMFGYFINIENLFYGWQSKHPLSTAIWMIRDLISFYRIQSLPPHKALLQLWTKVNRETWYFLPFYFCHASSIYIFETSMLISKCSINRLSRSCSIFQLPSDVTNNFLFLKFKNIKNKTL